MAACSSIGTLVTLFIGSVDCVVAAERTSGVADSWLGTGAGESSFSHARAGATVRVFIVAVIARLACHFDSITAFGDALSSIGYESLELTCSACCGALASATLSWA